MSKNGAWIDQKPKREGRVRAGGRGSNTEDSISAKKYHCIDNIEKMSSNIPRNEMYLNLRYFL